MADTGAPLLTVRDLHAWYGESHVLHGVDFEVKEGEVVTLLGRNGAGKTTTLRSIIGILRRREGSIVCAGTETIRWPSNRIARLGLAYCPEERGIFASKKPSESKKPWDYYKLRATIPAAEAFRPISEGNCPLVK